MLIGQVSLVTFIDYPFYEKCLITGKNCSLSCTVQQPFGKYVI